MIFSWYVLFTSNKITSYYSLKITHHNGLLLKGLCPKSKGIAYIKSVQMLQNACIQNIIDSTDSCRIKYAYEQLQVNTPKDSPNAQYLRIVLIVFPQVNK